jgi:serine/threonine protein kinase
MAEVWKAMHQAPGQPARLCALKRIRPELAKSGELVRMFADETRLTAGLRHPNIVEVHATGMAEGTSYFAMEYLDGVTLAATLTTLARTRRWMSPGVASYIAQQIGMGLEHAHTQSDEHGRPCGIVHRDVSPGNVMLLRDGRVKLVDFGVAKAANHLRQALTAVGKTKGKPSYMAPEQVRGQRVDPRTDVFALGVVLWEMLACRPLFRDKHAAATARQVLCAPIVPPSRIRAEVSERLDAIVSCALEREPERRFPSAAALVRALGPCIDEGADPRRRLAMLVNEVADGDPDAALLQEHASERQRPQSRPGGEEPTVGLGPIADVSVTTEQDIDDGTTRPMLPGPAPKRFTAELPIWFIVGVIALSLGGVVTTALALIR